MTSIQDILSSDFLSNISSVSVVDMAIGLLVSFALGLFILLCYKKTYSGVMYSESFAISLMAMTVITCLIILAVTSNIVLSLGMVGALSIVRFRAAIKEPLDIAYLFWSISIGIVVGAGYLPLAVLGTLFIGLILVIFVNKKSNDNPYILVLQLNDDSTEDKVLEFVAGNTKKHLLKSKTVSEYGIEMTVEVRLKEMQSAFVNQLCQMDGVRNVSLVGYNGQYMS